MELILQLLVIGIGTIVSFSLFLVAIKLIFVDKNDYEANRRLSGSFSDAARGEVSSFQDGVDLGRNHKVCAGLAFNKKTKSLVLQGALSDEALSTVLK